MNGTLAVTGGTGLVGGAVIDAAGKRGWTVRALARSPDKMQSRAASLQIVKGDLANGEALDALCAGADAVVHCAGLTFARDDADYERVNVAGARAVARAAATAARFVHISSLSARAPELSPYAASKRASEDAVAAARAGAGAICLRLPAIYGPGDLPTLPYFKLVRAGWALEPAAKPSGRASILYVDDAADAVLTAADPAFADRVPAGVYDVGDDREDGRSWAEIGETLGAVFGRAPRRVPLPRPLVALRNSGAMAVARLKGDAPTARTGQTAEFFHPDWVARENLFAAAANWAPARDLRAGFEKTVQWYQDNGYL
ncbi:MAG: NAD-dependent epimerase/dehydratase family protein [Pseudomonadota bacterium]